MLLRSSEIEKIIEIFGSGLRIIPISSISLSSFVLYPPAPHYDYYKDLYIKYFDPNLMQLPSGSNLPPSVPSGTVIASNGSNNLWNGSSWINYIPLSMDSEDTSPEFVKEKPAWLKETYCQCGCHKTYGKDYPADKHSDWCDIYKEEMKLQAINKISSDDVPF